LKALKCFVKPKTLDRCEVFLIDVITVLDDARSNALRREMVETQIRARGVRAERVLEAMLAVPRHAFVPGESLEAAYSDHPLNIGEGQTISQPYIVAAMAEALELRGGEKLLDVGTGSGYSAAILSMLGAQVFTIETHASLAELASSTLAQIGCANIALRTGDGSQGWPEAAPFDAITVAAAAPCIPNPLVEQLGEGGRMVIPVGNAQEQELVLVRKSQGEVTSITISYCRFVPLTGQYGFAG
jgi:protein-L-isoaspartate(D-aspartate) O-methyltransferase